MKNIHIVLKNGTPFAAYENEADSKDAMERNGGRYLCQTISIPYIESNDLSEEELDFEDEDNIEYEEEEALKCRVSPATKKGATFIEMVHVLSKSEETIVAKLPISTMYGDTHLFYTNSDFYKTSLKEKLESTIYTICPVQICERENYLEVVEDEHADFYIVTLRDDVPSEGTILPISTICYYNDKIRFTNHDFGFLITKFVTDLLESPLIMFHSPIIGYKLTDPNGCCKNYCYYTEQNEINVFSTADSAELHKSGFHFATKAIALLGWYRFNKNNLVYRCQVPKNNAIVDPDSGIAVTNELMITKKLEWSDVFKDLVQQYEG